MEEDDDDDVVIEEFVVCSNCGEVYTEEEMIVHFQQEHQLPDGEASDDTDMTTDDGEVGPVDVFLPGTA